MYPSIRLYYPGGKAGSFGTLAEGYLRAFRDLGIKHAAFDYREPPDEDGFSAGGSNYDLGLYLGEPTHLNLMRIHTSHLERLVMVAPNGLGIPSVIAQSCKLFGIRPISPSEWGASVVAKATGMPVEVAPHGVHVEPGQIDDGAYTRAVEEELWADIQNGAEDLNLLHITSTASDRKGTVTLLEAMSEGRISDFVRLTIHCDRMISGEILDMVSDLPIRASRKIDVHDHPLENDGTYGCYLRSFDGVVQPSRAEGFGLVPLEAASLGIPVIMTPWTGHAMFRSDIEYQEVDSQDCLDDYQMIDGENFPVRNIDPMDVASAVSRLRDHYVVTKKKCLESAPRVREKWSWTNVVKNWLEGRSS